MINFREIDKENLIAIIDLQVADDQKDLVAINAISIAQAHYSDKAWFRAIYDDETPVGFIMLSLDHTKRKYWVWRFMIDEKHQLKGYGKAAMLKAIAFVKTISEAQELFLTYVPKAEFNAKGFYEKLGFNTTGEIKGDEVVMKLVF